MVIFRRSEKGAATISHLGKLIINPTLTSTYVNTDGTLCEVSSDIIIRQEYQLISNEYTIILPGLMEWVERYRSAFDKSTNVINPEFDWAQWHRDGLLFTKELYRRLPRHIPVRYVTPLGDESGLIEDFDVESEEQIDMLLNQLEFDEYESTPSVIDSIGVGVKTENDQLIIRLKIKAKYDTFLFSLDYDRIVFLKDFLVRTAQSEWKAVEWESMISETGIYLYPQTIGAFRYMYRLYVFSKKKLIFTAYVDSREFVKSIYKSIMTNVGCINDRVVSEEFQSDIVEGFIDDKKCENISLFKRLPKLASLGSAAENVKKYLQKMYDAIHEENE